jgi:O-antigen ligase
MTILANEHVQMRSAASGALADRLGIAVAFAILLAVFVTLNPFPDMEAAASNDAATYFLFVALTAAAAAILVWRGRLGLLALVRWENLLLLFWLGVAIVLSDDPETSARRFVLAAMVFLLAAALPWLTTGLKNFADVMLAIVVTVTVLSFLGVALVPGLAIHQASDPLEPAIAGAWRGIYSHKNLTSSVMVVFGYLCWFSARNGRKRLGIAIGVATAIFLIFTHGKSAIGLVAVAIVVAALVERAPSLWLKLLVALGPLALLNVLAVGSAVSESIEAVVALLPIDPTFTGRTDIWRYVFHAAQEHPIAGYGFEAYWYNVNRQFNEDETTRWLADVATSHNSYIDLALTIGVPGLACVLLAFVIAPLRDFHNRLASPDNRAFAYLCLMMLLYTLYAGTFEAFFMGRAHPLWFVLALAVCGLRYAARYEIRGENYH